MVMYSGAGFCSLVIQLFVALTGIMVVPRVGVGGSMTLANNLLFTEIAKYFYFFSGRRVEQACNVLCETTGRKNDEAEKTNIDII